MFGYNRRALLCLTQNPNLNTKAPFFLLLQLQPLSSSSNHNSFTVKYLVNTVGFSPQIASKLSDRVRLHNSVRPDSVLALFRSYGFSITQFRGVIQTYPNLLICSPNRVFLPKFNFLLSKGASSSDLVRIVTKNPKFLTCALKDAITPCYDFTKSFLLSDQSTLLSVKVCPRILYCKNPMANVQTLLQKGVPRSKFAMLFRHWPSMMTVEPPLFQRALDEVKELGFDPNTTLFILAVRAKILRKSLWEKKIGLYKKWGWSEDLLVSAFLRYPLFMLASEGKIEAMMEFFINQMGWEPFMLAKCPTLIMLSLEKRVAPRAFVLQVLQSKGLIKDAKLVSPFIASERMFLKRYVNCFEKEASQLLELYAEKRGLPR